MSAEFRGAIEALSAPGDIREIRALKNGTTAAGYFDDPDALCREAAKLDEQGFVVYVTANPATPALLARAENKVKRPLRETTSDKDVLRRKWLLIDCDPERPAGVSATDDEKNAALWRAREIRDHLTDEGWPLPVVGDSGNGGHLLYPVDLPNDPDSLQLIKGVLEALSFEFSDEAVSVDTGMFNAARITKLYGTTARKGDSTEDRPHRRSKLLKVPDERIEVSREQLQAVADTKPEPPKAKPERQGLNIKAREFDLAGWISDHGVAVKREGPWPGNPGGYRWILEECPWNGHTDNAAYIVRRSDGGIAAGCKHNSCQGYGWRELRQHYEPDAYDYEKTSSGSSGNESNDEKQDRRNQADRLIGYALEAVGPLFMDQHGSQHAIIDGDPIPLTSRCYGWLRRLMWEEEGRSVSGEYLKMAAGTLAAHAEFSGETKELYTRAAWHDESEALFYELRPGKVVRVGAGGWAFEANPPVLFRRYPNLKPLPDPKPSGPIAESLDVLDELVNLKTERDRRLFKAYLVTAALEHVGRPIFNASGAMGSGKTTIGRVVKRVWDPTAPETVRFDPRDFLQKAMHAYLLMLDNQNTIPEWAADTLCRLVTGEADSKRRLYTDDEDVIIELRRAVILNGINVPSDRGDVLDRSLVVELERIPDGDRKTEEQLWELFALEHPRILGSLFDILSKAMAVKPSLELSRRPRLADWGEYAAAVYDVLGWGAETFLSDWDEVVKVQNQGTLDGSPVAQAIIKLMEAHDEVSLTSSKMHAKLKEIAEEQGVDVGRDKAWPKSARWLWRRIKEVLPLLVAAGIDASRDDTNKASVIVFRRTSKNDSTNSTNAESPVYKPDTDGIRDTDDSTPNSTSNPTSDPANRAESGISGDSGIISGTNSEEGEESEPLGVGEPVSHTTVKTMDRPNPLVSDELREALEAHLKKNPHLKHDTPKGIAEDLYLFGDFDYEPTAEEVEQALAELEVRA